MAQQKTAITFTLYSLAAGPSPPVAGGACVRILHCWRCQPPPPGRGGAVHAEGQGRAWGLPQQAAVQRGTQACLVGWTTGEAEGSVSWVNGMPHTCVRVCAPELLVGGGIPAARRC